jgi:hypothetical protein
MPAYHSSPVLEVVNPLIHLVAPHYELRIISGTTVLEFIPMLAEIQYVIVVMMRKRAPA